MDDSGNIVLNFEYNDSGAWPTLPDGEGYSLTFLSSNLTNSSDGSLWSPSSIVGGTPGRGENINEGFSSWMTSRGETNPMNIKDGDLYNNLLTYAFGFDLSDDNHTNSAPYAQILVLNGNEYMNLEYQQRSNVTGVNYVIEYSQNLETWVQANNDDLVISERPINDNLIGISARMKENLSDSVLRFMRIRVLIE